MVCPSFQNQGPCLKGPILRIIVYWDYLEKLGALFGSPCNEDHSVLGSILGSLCLETPKGHRNVAASIDWEVLYCGCPHTKRGLCWGHGVLEILLSGASLWCIRWCKVGFGGGRSRDGEG